MDFQQLNSFIKVAECHSMTRAAEELFLSTSALKQQMDSLEADVGAQLFNRSPKGVTLTSAGRYFLQKSRDITSQMNEILWETKNISSGSNDTVYIGFRHMKITDYLYPEWLSSFLEKYPETNVSLVDMTQNSYDNVDLLLCDYIGNTEFDQTYHLRDVAVQCIMNTRHPLSSREEIEISELQDYSLIIPPVPVLRDLQPQLAKNIQELKFTYRESLLNKDILYINLLTSDDILITFGDEKHLDNVLSQIPLEGYIVDFCIHSRQNIQKPIVRECLNDMLDFYHKHK